MATTEPENLADTIRSRSQHFHFRALSFAEISDALVDICAKENLTAEPGAIGVMARAAEGSVRDGLSLLEQARAYCGSSITDAQVRELLGVVPGEILDELTHAIESDRQSAFFRSCIACSPMGRTFSIFAAKPSGIFVICWWRAFAERIPN